MENEKTFEESLAALEDIVAQLEEGELPLEKSLELFEEGVRLSRKCQQKLETAERRIEMLVKDSDGAAKLEEFEEHDAEEA